MTVRSVARRALIVVGVVAAFAVALIAAVTLLSPSRPAARVTRPQVAMSDGVRLAVDVVLPEVPAAARLPTVLLQTRYWRSFALRVPDEPGKPPVGPRDVIVDRLIEAGYAVVVADVRGTGASEGVWLSPWSSDEVKDAHTLIAWIAEQPWSNGRVGATGLSYEGTTALLSATTASSALRAVLAREVEWDLAAELLAPGGVRNVSFVAAWARSVAALDADRVPELFPSYTRVLVTGVHPVDGDAAGAALARVVAARRAPTVASDVEAVRSPADPFGNGGPPASAVGPSFHAAALSRTQAALGLWGGWWDAATADAVFKADAAVPLVDAVVGPWTHEGDASASPFHGDGSEVSTVDLGQVVAFFDRYLRADGPRTLRRRWYVAGAEQWRESTAWPQTATVSLSLRAEAEPVLSVDLTASTGPTNRWNTGMLKPVDYGDRRKARGLLRLRLETAQPASSSVFGAPRFRCAVQASEPAALFVYLEATTKDGRVHMLTEGVARLDAGNANADVRLLPIAFELPRDAVLQIALAGADADTFERVSTVGTPSLRFQTPCALELPTVLARAASVNE